MTTPDKVKDSPAARADDERLIARLKTWPDREPARDLVPAVMDAVRALPPARRRFWPAWAAAAAVVLLMLGGWWRMQDPQQAALREAAMWLVSAQREDGRWVGNRADNSYDPALTALGLLAGRDFGQAPGAREACARAARWLVSAQAEDGRLGPSFAGSPYNQGLGALALLTWSEANPAVEWRTAAEKAVRRIVATQAESGGWGYGEGDPAPNVSITIWQLQALRKAESMGLEEATPALRRGLRWLRTTRNDRGLYGYRKPDDFPEGSDALTAMSVLCELNCDSRAGQRDDVRRSLAEVLSGARAGAGERSYYTSFFIARVLRQAGGEDTTALLDQVQKTLLARQIRRGDARGSWDPSDTYSGVGGPVYATTMAVLALRK